MATIKSTPTPAPAAPEHNAQGWLEAIANLAIRLDQECYWALGDLGAPKPTMSSDRSCCSIVCVMPSIT